MEEIDAQKQLEIVDWWCSLAKEQQYEIYKKMKSSYDRRSRTVER